MKPNRIRLGPASLLRVLVVASALVASTTGQGATFPLCERFAARFAKEGQSALMPYVLYPQVDAEGWEQYQGLDIDGDGRPDELSRACSPSYPMPDPCELDLKLSSGRKFEFSLRDQERFFVAKIGSHVYAVETPDARSRKRPGPRSILTIGKRGIIRVCDGL